MRDLCGWWWCEKRKGRAPCYVLTNEPVESEEQAWDMAFSYVWRWNIEEQCRFQKPEWLIESRRLRDWEPRRKLLVLVTLAYGFLLWMRAPPLWLARWRLLGRLRATRRLATVERQTAFVSPPLGAETGSGSLILPPHLAALLLALVDDLVASVRISVLKLCSGSCCDGSPDASLRSAS
jgi:hypothetical protein